MADAQAARVKATEDKKAAYGMRKAATTDADRKKADTEVDKAKQREEEAKVATKAVIRPVVERQELGVRKARFSERRPEH